MRFFRRFGGLVAMTVLVVVFGILGFASTNPGLLLVSLLCLWPALWAVIAWTIRGLRDNYQLVPKGAERQVTNGPRQRTARQVIPEEY